MAFYDSLFNAFGLREWCDASAGSAKMTMASLLAKTNPDAADEGPLFPFPSMDELYKACPSFPQSREFTAGVEEAFLNAKDVLKTVLDPLTQPLSWLLEGALFIFLAAPWWIVVPLILLFVWYVCRSVAVTTFVTVSFAFLAFIDHLDAALQTLAIIAVCTGYVLYWECPLELQWPNQPLSTKFTSTSRFTSDTSNICLSNTTDFSFQCHRAKVIWNCNNCLCDCPSYKAHRSWHPACRSGCC